MENKVTLALDWTPNINHIGFFVAREKGFYKKRELEVEIIDPAADNYSVTPAKKVEKGEADFALCPTESVISYRTKSTPFDLIGVATVFQKDLSAIAVRAGEGIDSPKDLDGKSYASYEARYEDGIVKQMMRNDGGEGSIKIGYPNKLGIWETIINKTFDSTWIFLNWEGVEAEALRAKLNYFKMAGYGIPYSYSPLLVASEAKIGANREAYKAFVEASKKGFRFCQTNPAEAVDLFQSFVPEKDEKIDLMKALEISNLAFGKDWGTMNEKVISDFLDWVYQNKLESIQLEVSHIVTNELL
ncbi:ABC transporter substrate-binding protein [Cryomorphaceae bacterium 1068]|nr:ABC transporter substrate-binding protein [Cryomorphaceae bacterium 1068]